MRSFIASMLLFAIFCCAIAANSVYVSSSCDDMRACAEHIKSGSTSSISELEALWRSHRYLFGFSVAESKIERMDELILSLRSAINAQSSSEIPRLCSLIEELCEDISIYERITLQSIF